MFLSNRCLGGGPALTEPVQERQDHLREGLTNSKGDQETIERRLSRRLVQRVKAALELRLDLGEGRHRRFGLRALGELRQARGLGGGEPCVDVCAHRPDAALVLLGIELKKRPVDMQP